MSKVKKDYTKFILIIGIILFLLALYYIYKDTQKDLNNLTTVTGIIQDVDKNYVSGKRGRVVFINALLKYKDGRLVDIHNWSDKLKLYEETTLVINGFNDVVSINGEEL